MRCDASTGLDNCRIPDIYTPHRSHRAPCTLCGEKDFASCRPLPPHCLRWRPVLRQRCRHVCPKYFVGWPDEYALRRECCESSYSLCCYGLIAADLQIFLWLYEHLDVILSLLRRVR